MTDPAQPPPRGRRRCAPTSTTGRCCYPASASCCAHASRRSCRCRPTSSSGRSPARPSASAPRSSTGLVAADAGRRRRAARRAAAAAVRPDRAVRAARAATSHAGGLPARSAACRARSAARAEELYADSTTDGQEAARQLFLRLVTLGEGMEDTRRRVSRDRARLARGRPGGDGRGARRFGASRLLSFDRDSAHAASRPSRWRTRPCSRAWRRLRAWIDAAREDVRTERRLAVAAQRVGRTPAAKPRSSLDGSRLEQFEAWRKAAGISSTPGGARVPRRVAGGAGRGALAEEERADHERALERRSISRLRALVAVLAVAALVAAGLTVFAFSQQRSAAGRRARDRARPRARGRIGREPRRRPRTQHPAGPRGDRDYTRRGWLGPAARREEALHRAVRILALVLSRARGSEGALDWSPQGVSSPRAPRTPA